MPTVEDESPTDSANPGTGIGVVDGECNRLLTEIDRMKITITIVPTYEIAVIVAVVLFTALAFMVVMMRQQVHHARFGDQEISPWEVRFSNNLFGQYGIWKLHKGAYERSGLRSSFVAASAALLVSIIVGIFDFLYVRYGL